MALIKLNNRAVKDATAFGSISSLGSLTFISTQTASASASISFTTGIDSTYKEYLFIFNNLHPATDSVQFNFNLSTDGGSSYNVVRTTTFFTAYHNEDDSGTALSYGGNNDLAQALGGSQTFGELAWNQGADADQSVSGYLQLFNPSSNVFVKHYIGSFNQSHQENISKVNYIAGYGNTTSAVNAIDFQFSSGNIDDGTIQMFGIL